jgi:hypothetical protein
MRVFCTTLAPRHPLSHRSSIHTSSRAASGSDSSSSRQSHGGKAAPPVMAGGSSFRCASSDCGQHHCDLVVSNGGPRTFRGTCRFMHRVCKNPKVGRHINLGLVSSSNTWRNTIAYQALLHRVTNIGNPQACFITGMHAVFPGPVFTAPRPVLDENLKRAAAGILHCSSSPKLLQRF